MVTYFMDQSAYDAELNAIKTVADSVTLCAGAPATYAEATTVPAGGKMLAQAVCATDNWTLASDGADGRKITLADRTDASADASGNADHVAVVASGTETLLAVVPLTGEQAITVGNPVTIKDVVIYARALQAVA